MAACDAIVAYAEMPNGCYRPVKCGRTAVELVRQDTKNRRRVILRDYCERHIQEDRYAEPET